MKTTLEISDHLFHRAKKLAAREGKTMRAVVEESLTAMLAKREVRASPFKLDLPVVKGELQPEFQGASWDQIRAAIYPAPTGPADDRG